MNVPASMRIWKTQIKPPQPTEILDNCFFVIRSTAGQMNHLNW